MSSLEQFLGEVASVASVQEASSALGWPGRIRHLSATSIGMFRRCPEQFRHRYILGEKERPGEGLVVGSAFHEGVEYNYAQKIESHVDRPTAEVVEYLQDVGVPKVLEEQGGAEEIAWDSGDAVKGVDLLRRDSERILIRYHEDIVPRIQPISLEEQLFIEDPKLIVPIIGYIDVRSGYAVEMDTTTMWVADRVLDTKTGKQSVSKLKPSWLLQATLYGAMTGLPVEYHSISRAKVPKITTGLESPDMVFTPDPIKTANVIHSASQIALMIAWMYTTYGPDETWPTMGRFADWSMSFSPCTNCGWRKVCPAMNGEV
jgi:PD-(D/E)XK nuclease superfamily